MFDKFVGQWQLTVTCLISLWAKLYFVRNREHMLRYEFCVCFLNVQLNFHAAVVCRQCLISLWASGSRQSHVVSRMMFHGKIVRCCVEVSLAYVVLRYH